MDARPSEAISGLPFPFNVTGNGGTFVLFQQRFQDLIRLLQLLPACLDSLAFPQNASEHFLLPLFCQFLTYPEIARHSRFFIKL
jgi:hypothetical protein